MRDKIQRALHLHRLIRPGQNIVVAVSGGSDSTALLLALHEIHPRLGVAHLNHGIRGRDADRDESFVRALAGRLKLPFILKRCDVPALARRKKISMEMAARAARHDFFRGLRADAIAVAHTADDQAETVLMRLARGTGTQGLGGMTYESRVGGLRLIRPMLNVTHAEAQAFLRERGQAWREDKSNRDPAMLRNRIRREVLPFLEKKLNPALRAALARHAEIAGAENATLEALAAKIRKRVRLGQALRVDRLARLDVALQRRVVQAWLIERGIAPEALDFDVIGNVGALAESRGRARELSISIRARVVRSYNRLEFRTGSAAKAWRVRLKIPGATDAPGQGFRVVTRWTKGIIKPPRSRVGAWPAEATLSRKALGRSAVYLRSWRPGDRMRPLGLAGSKKLQDIFTDAKVPREERARVPVLECRGQVVWLPGYRVAQGWAVEGPRAESLRIILKSAV